MIDILGKMDREPKADALPVQKSHISWGSSLAEFVSLVAERKADMNLRHMSMA